MKDWKQITHFAGFDWAKDHHDVIILDRAGTIVAEFTDMPVPNKTEPAMVAQSTPHFAECVTEVSKAFQKVLATPREELHPIVADGSGHAFKMETGS